MEREPAEIAKLMAHALLYFDDPRARAATDRFFADPELAAELRRAARSQLTGRPPR